MKKIASLMQFYEKAYRIIGVVVAIIGIMLLPFLNLIIQEQPNIQESIYLLYLINLFNTASTYFFSYRSSLIIAAQQNYLVVGINYIVTILQSFFQIFVLLVTRNYLLYLLIQTVGTLIYNVLVSHLAVVKFPYIASKEIEPLDEEEKRNLFANVRDLMIYKISGLLVNSTDNILITFFKGLTTTGIASNYTMLSTMLNSLLNQMFNGLTASVGNHNAIESNEKRHEMFLFLDFIGFWIFGWATLGIYFCSSDIVQLCFGKDYVLPESIPFIIAFNFYLAGITNVIGMYKHTMGLFHYGRFMQVITAIVNILFSVILGKHLGVFGILAATAIARIFTHIWYTPYVVYKHGFHMCPWPYVKKHGKYWAVLVLVAFLCQIPFQLIKEFSLINVLLKMVVCSIIVNVIFLIIFSKTHEFKKLKQYFFENVIKAK